MPELKGIKITNFNAVKDVDLNTVAYSDKAKENERQVKLNEYLKTGIWPGTENKRKFDCVSWSKNTTVLDKRREKKAKLSEKKQQQKLKEEEGDSCDDELEADYKLTKKLKKGKLSQDAFDEAFELDKV